MNIDYSKRKLNESVDISPTEFAEINSASDDSNSYLDELAENYQKLFQNNANLFKFSNGVKMAKINANVAIDGKFSLRWHADKAIDVEDFLNSVSKFIKAELTKSEISQLTTMYNQLYPEF